MEKKKKTNKLAKPLREMEPEALAKELGEAKKNVFALRMQSVTQKLENPKQATAARKQIARIKTLIRERQLAKAPGSTTATNAPAPVAVEKKAVAKKAPAKVAKKTTKTVAAK